MAARQSELSPLQDNLVNDDHPDMSAVWKIALVYLGGGIIVCATYAYGVIRLGDRAMELWGRLASEPENITGLQIYYFSILMATIGYFPSTLYALKIAPYLSSNKLRCICFTYGGFFFSSCFWMPLCVEYVLRKQFFVFVLIRVNLLVSGLFGLAWTYDVCTVSTAESRSASSCLRVSGCLGSAVFSLHCAILDCVIWPFYFQ
eukprot:TRINITY_DN8001_c0_g1_i1.p2 TRINITY_DN8001_c0_g1~~TRINITY_DN8001_c0_g1_i1.p2  ORF type:complete len:203 (+),score=23.71 TRINITY_DN8001_c0_g1_i1:88-696(+)